MTLTFIFLLDLNETPSVLPANYMLYKVFCLTLTRYNFTLFIYTCNNDYGYCSHHHFHSNYWIEHYCYVPQCLIRLFVAVNGSARTVIQYDYYPSRYYVTIILSLAQGLKFLHQTESESKREPENKAFLIYFFLYVIWWLLICLFWTYYAYYVKLLELVDHFPCLSMSRIQYLVILNCNCI